MIKGIGMDMVEISRIEKACRKEHFLHRIFTAEEVIRFQKFPARLAGNFAVKEAVAKVFGTGFRSFYPCDIEVLRDEAGRPYINLYGGAKEMQEKLGITSIFVTITNEKEYACAAAVAEGEPISCQKTREGENQKLSENRRK
ncbi:MAG: holo-ACP synthase [Lachnospiraceae bacterium]|nr:holo-ACP synthase [Lachnospiraceae bacterium]